MENENNMITLGTRAIVELERYIRDTFTDCVKDCNICNRLCIRVSCLLSVTERRNQRRQSLPF